MLMKWQAAGDDSRVLIVDGIAGIADKSLAIVSGWNTVCDSFATLATIIHVDSIKDQP